VSFGRVVPIAITFATNNILLITNNILLITNNILLITNTNIIYMAASAHANTVRLPEALGIPTAMFTVQGGTARFAVRVTRYNT